MTKQSIKPLIDGLSYLLADTYVLYVKTQNFHWHIEGPYFYAYHHMFEEQYEALAKASDMIAERIRALDHQAPASLSAFLKLTSLKETDARLDAKQMIKTLLKDHETIANRLSKLLTIAQHCDDEVTLDLFIERKAEHEKIAWMLRSTSA